MPYFQNVFQVEFRGMWPLGDRQYNPTFVCPVNAGRGQSLVTSWNAGPYNLSGNDVEGDSCAVLNIVFASDPAFKGWTVLDVDITDGAVSAAAVTADEIVAALNADVDFASWFTANVVVEGTRRTVKIVQKRPEHNFRFYIDNGRAEEKLGFNERAGVSELPAYFARHTMDSRFDYNDSLNLLIELDPTNLVHAAIINNAKDYRGISLGFSSLVVRADWELLDGSAGIFTFKKQTVDGSSRVTQIIEYPAGAGVGDFARKTLYTYTAAQTAPDTIVQIPHVLENSDLITP